MGPMTDDAAVSAAAKLGVYFPSWVIIRCISLPEAAGEAAHQRVAESQQPLGDASGIHELGRADEERNRKQHIARVHAVEQLLGRGSHVEAGQVQVEHRTANHRVPDRQPEQAERDDRRHAEGEGAGRVQSPELTVIDSGAGGSLPRSRCHKIQA